MRRFGLVLAAIGLLVCLMAISAETSVESGYGRVSNLSLMHQQELWLILGGLLFVGGLILLVGAKSEKAEDELKTMAADVKSAAAKADNWLTSLETEARDVIPPTPGVKGKLVELRAPWERK